MCDIGARLPRIEQNGFQKIDTNGRAGGTAVSVTEYSLAYPYSGPTIHRNGCRTDYKLENVAAQTLTYAACQKFECLNTVPDAVFAVSALVPDKSPSKEAADEEADIGAAAAASTASTDDDNSDLTFDPYEYGNVENATSYWGTVMHMLIVALSPTLLSLPQTFSSVGYAIGALGSFCTVLLYAYCMHMIVDGEYLLCKRLRRAKMSYTQVVHTAFASGPQKLRWMASYATVLIYGALLTVWAGGNSIYVLLISENVRSALAYFCHYDVADRAVIGCLVVPLVLLCWIPNLKLMVFYSMFSNTVNVCSIVVILCIAAADLPLLETRTGVGNLADVPYFIGMIFVTVNGTGLMMSLKNQMANPRQFRSKTGVLNVSYATTGLLYAFFGFICYAQYGSELKDNVFLNLPNTVFTNGVKLLYALAIVFFYPLVSYVTFDIVWNDMAKDRFKGSANEKAMVYLVKTASALSSIVFAYIFPNMAIFVSFTGTVCASFDSIIMPAVINMLVYSHEKRIARLVKNIAIVTLGLSFIVIGISDSFQQLGTSYDET